MSFSCRLRDEAVIAIRIYLGSELIWPRLSFNQIHPGPPNNRASVRHSRKRKTWCGHQLNNSKTVVSSWAIGVMLVSSLIIAENEVPSLQYVCKECGPRPPLSYSARPTWISRNETVLHCCIRTVRNTYILSMWIVCANLLYAIINVA